jgi:hypothetical protein
VNGWFNPDNALDLFSQALLILGGLAIAIVPSWFASKAHKTSQAILSETRNGHNPSVPMRADLDRVIESIERLSHDVSAIRRDLADEENRRRDHVTELRDELHRKVNDLHRKFGTD